MIKNKVENHTTQFSKTAFYSTQGSLNEKTKRLIVVFHGYGQLARHIIRKFENVPSSAYILAPEGLSRFYWNESKGIVGASWMTSLDRLDEIADYCKWINQLIDQVFQTLGRRIPITFLGFSQGGATAVRYVDQDHTFPVEHLILWGAGFPKDIDYRSNQPKFSEMDIKIVMGRQDPYIKQELLETHQQFTAEQGLQYEEIWFDGAHEIDRDILLNILVGQ